MRAERRRAGRAIRKSRRLWRESEAAFVAFGEAAARAARCLVHFARTMAESVATVQASSATALSPAGADLGCPTQSGVTRGTRAPVACERTSPEGGF